MQSQVYLLLAFLLELLSVTIGIENVMFEPGIMGNDVALPYPEKGNLAEEYLAFVHSAYKDTNVKVTISCDDKFSYKYSVQFLLRSSPCDKEYFEVLSSDAPSDFFNMYFLNPNMIPQPFDYQEILYYASAVQQFNCHDGPILLKATKNMSVVSVSPTGTSQQKNAGKKVKRASQLTPTKFSPVNASYRAIVMEHPNSLSTQEKTITLPVDAMYLLLVKVIVTESPPQLKGQSHNISVEVKWKGPQGYLGAINWPLLPFYGAMCGVYGILALAWLIISACQWKDLLRVQFWIGAVILLGMLEKAVFYAECQSLNSTGKSVEGAIQFAELVSCLKRTLARMLVIVVSVGFGVVKPRLGSTLHKVVGVGFVYFILCAIEAIMRVSKAQAEAVKQKQLAGLPLTLLEVAIFWWIFSSLVNTMRALRLRRNEVKLSLYRHFTNTLIFAVLASVAFMLWSLFMHVFTTCLRDWKELWVDTAFWHVLFSVILLVIMILWRPTNNNQRYAFTPLLDAEEDEDDDDTLFSEAFTTAEATKLRGMNSTTKAENRRDRSREQESTLEEELKWVEEHIPSSLADKALPALVDSDEEAQQSKFEISKMQ